MSGYSYSSAQVQIICHRPHLLHLSTPFTGHIVMKKQNNATLSLLPIIEQHEWCVASISRRHCATRHYTVPHNGSRVTCLAVYSNILFYELDEASSNAVSSRGGIVAKCLFSCCCWSSALAKTHNILLPVYTCWQVVSIQPLYECVNTFLDESGRLILMVL